MSDPDDAIRSLNPLSAIAPSSLTGFLDRPLFSQTRSRPEAAPVETEEPVATDMSDSLNIQLLGVVVTPDGATARIVDLDDDSRHSLHQGEAFRDWTVVSVNPSELTIANGDATRTFPVFKRGEATSFPPPEVEADREPAGDPNGEADPFEPPRNVRIVPLSP